MQQYRTCVNKHRLAQDVCDRQENLQTRITKLNASLNQAQTNFLATPFEKLKLRDSQSLGVQDVQQKVQKLADYATGMQNVIRSDDPEHPGNKLDRLGDFNRELIGVRASLNELRKSNVPLSEDPEAVAELEAVVRQYERIFPPDLFQQPKQSAAAEKVVQDAKIAFRLVTTIFAGTVTVFAAIGGWQTGNVAPAMMAAATTAAAIFGVDRLLEGPAGKISRELGFLDTKEYETFFAKYQMGKTWGKTIEELQGHGPQLAAIAGEKDPAKQQNMLKEIGFSTETEKRAARILASPKDFPMLVRICNEGSADSKAVIVTYVEKGAPRSALAIAKNPQSITQKA